MYLKEGTICPQCECGVLKETTRELVFNYKGETCEFKSEKVFACDHCECDYAASNWDDMCRIGEELRGFCEEVDKG